MDGWADYRDRVERELPNYERVRFARAIEELLVKLKALDGEIAALVRPLVAEDFATLNSILAVLRVQAAAAVGIGPERDYAQWYNEFVVALGAGQVDFAAWARGERLGSLIVVSDRMVGLRQVAPQPPGSPRAAPGSDEIRDPAIVAASQPLFQRFGAIIGRVAPGSAGAAVDAELESLLAAHRALAVRTAPGTPDRGDCDFRIGMVLNQLGRSAAFLGQGARAAEWFGEAADVWRALGNENEVADCLQRSAVALLASDGDVDRALEQMLRELDRQPENPTLFTARLLAQIASILANAGDPFDAATRARDAADVLGGLGFVDPTPTSAEAAFAEWMATGCLSDRTQATLSSVTALWASITGTRIDLAPADRPASGMDAADSVLTTLLSDLAALAERLGREANEATHRLDADLRRLVATAPMSGPVADLPVDVPLADSTPDPLPTTPTGIPTDADQDEDPTARGRRLAEAISKLRDRWDVTEDEPGLNAILAEAGDLERQATDARLPALAASAALLRGDTLSWLGRNDECADLLTQACDDLAAAAGIADSERRVLLVRLLIRIAMALTIHGDLAGSSAAAERGIAIAELDRGKASSPFLQDSYLRERRRLYDTGVFAAYKLDDRDLLLRRAELAKARGSLGWLASQAGVQGDAADGAGGRGAPADIAEPAITDLEAEFRSLTTRASDPQAAARRSVVWTRLMAERARAHGTAALAPFRLGAVQERLGPEDAIVYHYWLSQATLLIVTIDQRDTAVDKIDLTDRRDDLASLAADIAALTSEVRWLDQEVPPLGELLLPRTGTELLEGKRRLFISPQGFLHQLPFHAFDWQGEPLISRFAVSYIPNLATLLADHGPLDPAGGVLAFGVSKFPPPNPPLASAPREIDDVMRIYGRAGVPVTALLDRTATLGGLDALRTAGDLQRFQVLHFATHGKSGPTHDPFAARLFLADGELDGLEISQWELGAELVVLSACQLGQRAIFGPSAGPRADGSPGEPLFGDEMFGLPAALFSAGAREVLGALWLCKDDAALAIMPALHEHLADGRPCDEALSLAVDAYRRQTPHLFNWAPFKLVSIGRPVAINDTPRS